MIATAPEHVARARCFGGEVSVHVGGDAAAPAAAHALETLRDFDRRLSRFRPDSELSLLNASTARQVGVSQLVADLAVAVIEAGRMSGGLVDATILPSLLRAGYRESLDELPTGPPPPDDSHRDEQTRAMPAIPGFGWNAIRVLPHLRSVIRPPGLAIDSGGLTKGMAADTCAAALADHPSFCISCAGDLVVGGSDGAEREIVVDPPFAGGPRRSLRLARGAVATSGTTRRSWAGPGGERSHHLIDPGRGVPAHTGIVQATAVAPSGLEAEIRSKAALLAGPGEARAFLPFGGVLHLDDGTPVDVPAEDEL